MTRLYKSIFRCQHTKFIVSSDALEVDNQGKAAARRVAAKLAKDVITTNLTHEIRARFPLKNLLRKKKICFQLLEKAFLGATRVLERRRGPPRRPRCRWPTRKWSCCSRRRYQGQGRFQFCRSTVECVLPLVADMRRTSSNSSFRALRFFI